MTDITTFASRVMSLREKNSEAIKELARDAALFASSAELVVDLLYRKVKNSNGLENLVGWYLLDAVIKTTSFGRSTIAPRVQRDIVALASEHIPWGEDAAMSAKYRRVVDTWRALFGEADVETILAAGREREDDARLRHTRQAVAPVHPPLPQASPPPSFANAALPPMLSAMASQGEQPRSRDPMQQQQQQQQQHHQHPSHHQRDRAPIQLGKLEAWADRPENKRHLPRYGQLPARPPKQDAINPPVPVEISVPVPLPSAGAPSGHVKAPPVDHTDRYVQEKREKMLKILRNSKRKREDEEVEETKVTNEVDKRKLRLAMQRRLSRLIVNYRFVAPVVDMSDWPTMPDTFPRDPDTGVQIGNYVDGVKFLRDAVREAGGALELDRLNNKVPEIKSLANRIKSIREFIDIHTPTTFRVTREEGRIIVRLADQPLPQEGETPSWLATPCPECGKVVPGHNLPKHRFSKVCVGIQMLLGKEGKGTGTISQLSALSYKIIQDNQDNKDELLDDDDLLHLGTLIDKACDNFRVKFSRKDDWTHVWRALRAIHQRWLDAKGVETASDAHLEASDSPMIKFLKLFGGNLYRLPISYLDFGELLAMAGPFVEEFKDPKPKPPRFGSTKVRPKECASPGLVFCDSDLDSDNPPDIDSESEDDGKEEDYAAPLTQGQILATVGTDDQKNKKKLLQMAASSIEWRRANPLAGEVRALQYHEGRSRARPPPRAARRPPPQSNTSNTNNNNSSSSAANNNGSEQPGGDNPAGTAPKEAWGQPPSGDWNAAMPPPQVPGMPAGQWQQPGAPGQEPWMRPPPVPPGAAQQPPAPPTNPEDEETTYF